MAATSATRVRLVSIYGASSTLSALAAARWEDLRRAPHRGARVVTLVHPPTPSEQMARETAAVVARLVASQGWPEPVVLTDADVEHITRPGGRESSYRAALERFRRAVGLEHVDEILYAHDVVGRVPELAMNAYPRAERVMYGDGLGLVFDRRYLLALSGGASVEEALAAAGPSRTRLRQVPGIVRGAVRRLVYGEPQWPPPTRAALILPVDVTGDSLRGIELSVPSKEMVLEVIAECQSALPELSSYSRDILTRTAAPRYLMLLENFTDAGMTSLENETNLYEAAIRRHVPAGASVLLKEHPLVTASVAEALSRRIGTDYPVHILPAALSRYPVELWRDLAVSCEVVSMLSYCGMSLGYLYGKRTIAGLDDDMIEQFFYRHSRQGLHRAGVHLRGQMANLATWDGQGILWKGPDG